MSQQNPGIEPHTSWSMRYLSAWGEINTRITQRQNALALYATIALAAFGASLTAETKGGELWRCAYAVPLAALVLYLLVRMHEVMIQNLHSYLIYCERIDSPNGVPGYHLPENPWYSVSRRARRMNDMVNITLILSTNSLAAFPCVAHFSEVSLFEKIFMILLGLLVITLSILTYRIRYLRYRIRAEIVDGTPPRPSEITTASAENLQIKT